MIKNTRKNKKVVSALFIGAYLFAIMFSGFFHTHTNNFRLDLSSVKEAHPSAKVINFGGVDDCFSSHFFNASLGILDQSQDFSLKTLIFYQVQEFEYSFSFSAVTFNFSYLRGPPYFI